MRKVITILVFIFVFLMFFLICNIKTQESKETLTSTQIIEQMEEQSQTKDFTTQTVTATTAPIKKEIKISFLGDCMMASFKGQYEQGNMSWALDNKPFSYFFEKAMPYIGNDTFTIANCENVFTDTANTPRKKDSTPAFWFKSATKNAKVFSENSIDAVSIANNHTNDYGSEGNEDTKKALDDAGILWGDDSQVVYLESDGVKIGLICSTFWGEYLQENIVSRIKEIKDSTDIQIVFFHGGLERLHSPESWKKAGCHAFVDAGADLVVGAHPHVLQPLEQYKGVDIAYSLGNFCFGGNTYPENRTAILQETFILDENNKITYTTEGIIPFYVFTGSTNNWQPAPIEDTAQKQAVLDFMYGKRISPF